MEIQLNTILSFGKYKGKLVSELLPLVESSKQAEQVKERATYFGWIVRKTEHNISKELEERVVSIIQLCPKPKYSSGGNSSKGRYNGMGSYSGITFSDCYGDFGY
mgnify:CR=1 FL=1